MSKNKYPLVIQQQLDGAKNAKLEYDHAWTEAHQSAARGRRLAGHVLKMIDQGQTDGPARMGRFPNRHPYHGVAPDSVALATNAELKAAGKDVTVDVYDSSIGVSDPINGLDVVVKSINGEQQQLPDMYLMRTNPEEWRNQRAQAQERPVSLDK